MKVRQKQCPYCKDKFNPNHRLGKRQVSCGKAVCRREHSLKSKRKWKLKNKEICKEAMKDFRRDNPNYYKNYRKVHPEYTKRNREQTKLRKRMKKGGLQSRIDILQLIKNIRHYDQYWLFAKWNRSLLFPRCCIKQTKIWRLNL